MIDLKSLLDRPIAFHRCFVTLTGSVSAALMLSQAFYWSNRTSHPDGWFYKTREEWQEETGLDRGKQERARRRLRECGFMNEDLRGVPATMWFRIDFDALTKALEGSSQKLSVAEILTINKVDLVNLSRLGFGRAKKAGVEAELVDYAEILQRDQGICYLCDQPITRGPGSYPGALHFDHVEPIAKGGGHVRSNIRAAHSQCNLAKGDSDSQLAPNGTNWSALPSTNKGVPVGTSQLAPNGTNITSSETTRDYAETTSAAQPAAGDVIFQEFQERQRLEAERLAEKKASKSQFKKPFPVRTNAPKNGNERRSSADTVREALEILKLRRSTYAKGS